jgi:molybdate transport system substrate-binding protein
MEDVARAFSAQTAVPVRLSFAASSALARQIESGAPADVFVSADQDWMNYLAKAGLIRPETRANVIANSLILIAPANSRLHFPITANMPLAAALGKRGRLATGDPVNVPVGRYAQAALTQLGVWNSVRSRLIPADNVRTALNFVARGEAPLGIVYATDARAEPRVRVLGTFPAASHARILYPAAATFNARTECVAFALFLGSNTARAIFARAGFQLP